MSAPRTLDPAAARALDAAAMERLGIPGIILMEHAAIGVARIVESERSRLGLDRVLVVCGPGGNGGDGWAVARLLANRRVPVSVLPIASPTAGSDAAVNETIARRLTAEPESTLGILDLETEAAASAAIAAAASDTLVVDAMFGVGLARPIAGPAARIIETLTSLDAPIVAIDMPSGLDAATGRPLGPCVRAIVTATMVAPKTGMLAAGASAWTGRIEVVDIGSPPSLLDEFGVVAGSAPVGDDAAPPSSHGPR